MLLYHLLKFKAFTARSAEHFGQVVSLVINARTSTRDNPPLIMVFRDFFILSKETPEWYQKVPHNRLLTTGQNVFWNRL
jgi:hypothetical protein